MNKEAQPVMAMKRLSQDEYVKACDEMEEAKKSPNEKTYILLYYAVDEDKKDIKSFEVIKGRKEVYDYIKGMIEYIDIYESKVMVDNVPYSKAISVYEFMKYVSQFMEDSFDIEDYNYGDI